MLIVSCLKGQEGLDGQSVERWGQQPVWDKVGHKQGGSTSRNMTPSRVVLRERLSKCGIPKPVYEQVERT